MFYSMMGNFRLKFCVVFLTFSVSNCEKYTSNIVRLTHKDRGMNVNYMNDIRRDVRAADMREMEWDPVLAGHARRWGRQCIFQKDEDETCGQLLYSEYYDPTTRPGEILMNAIRSWAMQAQNYSKWRHCEREKTCEYMQMIYSETDSAGCAVTRCPFLKTGSRPSEEPDMHLVVCFVTHKFSGKTEPYTLGSRCSRCPKGLSCRKRLCSKRVKKWRNMLKKWNLPKSEGITIKEKYRQYFDSQKNKVITSLHKQKIADNTQPSLPRAAIRVPSSEIKEASLRKNRYLDEKGQIRIRPSALSGQRTYEQRGRFSSVISRVPSGSPAPRGSKRFVSSRRRQPSPSINSNRVKRQAPYDPYAAERERRRQERRRAQLDRTRQQQLRDREERERRRRIEYERELERRRRMRQERYHRRPVRPNQPAPIRALGGLEQTDKYYLEQVHNTLRATSRRQLKWDKYLERWAKYVIRCDIEYPGPVDCYTNFGKIDRESNVYNVVYDWGAEGDNVTRKLRYGCRTPNDIERCNHNSIVRHVSLRKFACAAMDCGRMRQLTCIYK